MPERGNASPAHTRGNIWPLVRLRVRSPSCPYTGTALISQKSVEDGSYRPLLMPQQQTLAVAEACELGRWPTTEPLAHLLIGRGVNIALHIALLQNLQR